MTKPADSREMILDILLEILEHDGYSHIVLRQALNKYQYLDRQDRAFITRVTEGTLEYLIQIDYMIELYSSVKLKKMKPLIRRLLEMSVYQIMYMDRVPDSAVCNEAVKLAVKRRFAGLKGFVNGVLRNISRGKDSITFPNDSIRYSMPQWILDRWNEVYDAQTVKVMLESFLKERPLTVRCNLNRAEKSQILKSLEAQGIMAEEVQASESVLYLSGYDSPEQIEAFRKGWIQVQDLSSSFVGCVAEPKPGDYVIDVCGAPGGKSLHVADLLKDSGHVEVRDLTEMKVQMIAENIERSGFTNMEARMWDALVLDEASVKKADIVLADLPCSGLGIIGKKPDIKYNVSAEQLDSLSQLQREILSVVQEYVKPGGLLIYSTCTINKTENEDNFRWFLERFPYEAADISGKLGEIDEPSMTAGYVQLLPGIHPCDGFFISAFRRNLEG